MCPSSNKHPHGLWNIRVHNSHTFGSHTKAYIYVSYPCFFPDKNTNEIFLHAQDHLRINLRSHTWDSELLNFANTSLFDYMRTQGTCMLAGNAKLQGSKDVGVMNYSCVQCPWTTYRNDVLLNSYHHDFIGEIFLYQIHEISARSPGSPGKMFIPWIKARTMLLTIDSNTFRCIPPR